MSNLSLDIEIVNPIESKSLFGGCSYCTNYYQDHSNYGGGGGGGIDGGWLQNVNVYNNYIKFTDFGNSDSNNHTLNGGYASDWNNYGGNGGGGSNTWDNSWVDNNNDGINDADTDLVHSYPGDNLSDAEKSWLFAHITFVVQMIDNKNLAELYGRGQHNGVFDALRHALWSALDHHDIGAQNAYDFHTLHETEHWNPIESPSDLINNGWGYNWSMANGDAQNNMNQFIIDFNHAVDNGQISIIP